MKELIPMDEMGVFADAKDVARVGSLYVAEVFGKQHKNVLRDIAKITESKSGLSEEFSRLNFELTSYADEQGKRRPAYAMTRDGFTMLVMGYTGEKAMHFKEAYIKRFNQMEAFIQTVVATRRDYPLLTENIKLLHENPRPYHFSNECDMINRLVIGMSAKDFRKAHDMEKGASIRPYLSAEELELMNALQKADIGLLISEPNFESRKRHLEWYKQKLIEKRPARSR